MIPKIIIVDDHRLFNEGLKRILSESNFAVVAQLTDGREVMHAIAHHRPNLVLLDINLPHRKGIEIGQEIKRDYPDVKILFLSMYNEDGFVKAAKAMKADGYLLKDSAGDVLLNAIKNVLNGEIFFEPSLLTKPNLHHDDYFAKTYSLSKREVEIIGLLREGKTSESIAAQLFVSFETIKSHRKNIYFKLGVSTLAEVIKFAVDEGI